MRPRSAMDSKSSPPRPLDERRRSLVSEDALAHESVGDDEPEACLVVIDECGRRRAVPSCPRFRAPRFRECRSARWTPDHAEPPRRCSRWPRRSRARDRSDGRCARAPATSRSRRNGPGSRAPPRRPDGRPREGRSDPPGRWQLAPRSRRLPTSADRQPQARRARDDSSTASFSAVAGPTLAAARARESPKQAFPTCLRLSNRPA